MLDPLTLGIHRLGGINIRTVCKRLLQCCSGLLLPTTAFSRYSSEMYGDMGPGAPGPLITILMGGVFLLVLIVFPTFRKLVLMLAVLLGAVKVMIGAYGEQMVWLVLAIPPAFFLYWHYLDNAEARAEQQSSKGGKSTSGQRLSQSRGSIPTKTQETPRKTATADKPSEAKKSSPTIGQYPPGAKINLTRTSGIRSTDKSERGTKKPVAVETFRESMEREKRERRIRKALIKIFSLIAFAGSLILVVWIIWDI